MIDMNFDESVRISFLGHYEGVWIQRGFCMALEASVQHQTAHVYTTIANFNTFKANEA